MKLKEIGSELDKLIKEHGEQAVMEQLVNWFGTTSFNVPATDADVEDIADGIRYAFFPKDEEEDDEEED